MTRASSGSSAVPRKQARPAKRAVTTLRSSRAERFGAGRDAASSVGSWSRMRRSSSRSAGARLEAQLLHQHAPTRPKDFERVGLSAGAVEREHQLAAKPFPQRLLDEESLDLPDELGITAEHEVGVDAVLERGEPQLLEAPALCGGELVVCEVDQRRAPPQRERLAQKASGLGGVLGLGRRREERLEATRVDLRGIDLELVARRASQKPVTAEQLAQTRDVELHHRRGGRWRPLAPERVDQLVGRDGLVRPQEQRRQQGALLTAAERDRLTALDGFERPQEQELDHGQRIVPRRPRTVHSRV